MMMLETQVARRTRRTASAWPVGLLLGLLSLWTAQKLAAREAVQVAAGIAPVRFLVAQIAGPEAEVALLVPTGASAESYDPKPRGLKRLAEADLLFLLDTPVERLWVPRLGHLNPRLTHVYLDRQQQKLDWSGSPLELDAPIGASDFHTWTSPVLMQAWIDPVVAALSSRYPASAAGFREHAARLRRELDGLDRELADRLAGFRGRVFLSQHPAWGYFASRYGLRQLSIEADGREPGPRQLRRVLDQARAAGVGRVIVPVTPADPATTRVARELTAELGVVNELAEDYPGSLRRLADLLVDDFQ